MLEGIGLVSKKHFVGYCTAPTLNRKQFEELYEMRMLIEPEAACYAATRMSDADIAGLGKHAATMQPRAGRNSYDLFPDQDSEFHNRIAAGSGNVLIGEALDRLHTHMHIFRLRFHSQIVFDAANEHDDVVKALQQRDAEAARAAMRDHIQRSYDRLVQFVPA